MSVKGTILLGKHTANHKTWLEGHGYKVSQEGNVLIVEGESFINEINMSENPVEILKNQVIGKHALFTYQTKALVTNKGVVKTLKSIPLCTILGPASALVVKPEGQAKAKTVNPFAAL